MLSPETVTWLKHFLEQRLLGLTDKLHGEDTPIPSRSQPPCPGPAREKFCIRDRMGTACSTRTWKSRLFTGVPSHFSRVRLFVTWCRLWPARICPWETFSSRHEYWSGLLCPPPGDLPDPGIEATSLMSPALAGRFFTTSTTWEVPDCLVHYNSIRERREASTHWGKF